MKMDFLTIAMIATLINFFFNSPAEAKQRKEKKTMIEVVDTYLFGKASPNAILTVKVVDEESKPITGAAIKIKQKESGKSFLAHSTDEYGRAEKGVPKNEYEIEINKEGYAAATKYVVLDRGMEQIVVLKKLPPVNDPKSDDRAPASIAAQQHDLDL